MVWSAFGFNERVNMAINAVGRLNKSSGRKVVVIGSSAGGLAALKAVAELGSSIVAGVIAVAPAPCGNIFPTAWECFWRMLKPRYMRHILRGRGTFCIYPEDLKAIALNGLSEDMRHLVSRQRIPLSGRECFDLLFNSESKSLIPELLAGIPTLFVLGTEDRWVRPGGQEAMLRYLNKHGVKPDVIRVKAGHMPCHTQDYNLRDRILGWVRKLQ